MQVLPSPGPAGVSSMGGWPGGGLAQVNLHIIRPMAALNLHMYNISICFLQMCSSGQYFLWLWRPCSPTPAWLPHVSCLPKVLHGRSELQVRQGQGNISEMLSAHSLYRRWTVSVPPSQLLLLRLLDLQLRSPPPGSGWEYGTC